MRAASGALDGSAGGRTDETGTAPVAARRVAIAASMGRRASDAVGSATITGVPAVEESVVSEPVQLRIPGPTPLPAQVREASSRQMINHRGPEFRALIKRITERLQHAFRTSNDLLILTASGTGGLEAAIVNHLSPGDPVLAVSIGSFGDRFGDIAQRYDAAVRRYNTEWGRAAEPDEMAQMLRAMAEDGSPARA
jgi:hypothetical protein